MSTIEQAVQVAEQTKHDLPLWAVMPIEVPAHLHDTSQACIDMYMLSNDHQSGGINGIGWWQWANGYTATTLNDANTHEHRNSAMLNSNIRKCEQQYSNFINEYNDDSLWWALLCLHTFNITGDQWFLAKAKIVWRHLRDSNSVCGKGEKECCGKDMEGGCYWTTRPGEGYINAITTGLYAELSVRLYLATHEPKTGGRHSVFSKLGRVIKGDHVSQADEYLQAARCSLEWIVRCVYRSDNSLIMDGIHSEKNELSTATFTYNTGVAIGASALLYQATSNEDYLTLACHMAHCAMRNRDWIEENGVLTDLGPQGRNGRDPRKNDDGVGFKAVLMRHLGTLFKVIQVTQPADPQARETAQLLKQFVNVNLDSQLRRNTNGNSQYGPWWNGPFECPTSHSQMAVLDVMAAAVLVNGGS
ncbi:glycoside hydrolase family 76 protein [Baudoinia panamericana UAMH 10762]|uniref:Glycoside hydrolase family 76 protein n=1 Tax=Baudoinia panamericana (strain UAMH 10762) TaxID=717646 RepID=M2LV16_BAUPA|nr:glycoside hydrolase family 76 protein [Baudoinia panamericana UAMH 10762]EMC98457.1 glycoside hydrolase family 76 protein [Baudoinia panamericana UAMH 10762]